MFADFKLKNLAPAIILVTVLTGCSHYGAARINSVPDGAEVINIDDGTVLGVTPTTVWWKDGSSRRQYMSVRLRKDGFYDKVASFWLSMRHSSQKSAIQNAQAVEVNMLPKKQ
ncbi:MAG: hypothetical protein ACRBHB_05050 [Arenicella sp.]